MARWRTALSVLALLCAGPAAATTWSEPWQREVVAKSDTSGLYEVETTAGRSARLHLIRHLGGADPGATLELDGYYGLRVASMSSAAGDDELNLMLRKGDRVYVFAKLHDGHWQTATPTAGLDVAPAGAAVHATYRISFMQALQAPDDYERVQSCIFRKLHHGSCDLAALKKQLDDPLQRPPAALSPTASKQDQSTFFAQHVALESAYLLDRSIPLHSLEPFLQSAFFHQQIAAVRALSVNKEPGRNARLVAFVNDRTRLPMAQIMAVLVARETGDAALIAELRKLASGASTEAVSLPIDIMDPRVATPYPSSVADALRQL